ncbi:MAG: hypothetical protein QOJ72_1905, partial [Nocardioidaceae bacterium]|nr:hypothetical protein [Nocardioidaceae bacterium]
LNKKAEAGLTTGKPVTVCVPTVHLS